MQFNRIMDCLKNDFQNYNIISLSVSNNQTAYITMLKEKNRYQQFRLSNHKHKYSFYSNRTFIYKHNNYEELRNEITEYLTNSHWYRFLYQDYFVLSLIDKITKYDITYFIDNTFNIFEKNKSSLVFYQENKLHRDTICNVASESMTKQLRKLFSTGLISSFPISEDVFRVYITKSGVDLKNQFDFLYLHDFVKDFSAISFKDIEIPPIDVDK